MLPGLRRAIVPKTPGPARLPAGRSAANDIVVGIGPAGTGKTYLAVAKAVEALARKRVKRIILARPAVEAGESLGFLPGDLQAKVDPYLRPLYDALEDMMPHDRVQRALETPDHRDRAAGLHARPHAGRRVHHPRRGAERHRRADEDVPHPARREQQDGGHRRQDADRSAAAGGLGAGPDRADAARASRASRSAICTRRDVVRHRLVREIIRAYAEDQNG